MKAALKISSKISMFDSPLKIWAEGLKSGQRVSIMSRVCHQNETFEAVGHYQANENGIVDCTKHASLDGSFKGVHPMGLFWSLSPAKGQKRGLRLMPRTIAQPMTYQFVLQQSPDEVLDQVICERLLIHPHVERLEITVGRLRGALFIPKNLPPGKRLPGVIDLYGTAGGLVEYRASLMASHGFAVFALAHFGFKDLPTDLNEIELEYFQEAAEWLTNHPSVLPNGVGVIGISFGADLAILLAMECTKIKAVAAINGLHMMDSFNCIKYKGELLPAAQGEADDINMVDGNLHYVTYRAALKDDPDLVYQIEKSDAKFLFLISEYDLSTPALHSARVLAERLKNNNKEKNCEIALYLKTGHLLEPPYIPFCPFSYHKVVGGCMAWGGEAEHHAKSQEEMWSKLRQFWSTHIGEPIVLQPLSGIVQSKL